MHIATVAHVEHFIVNKVVNAVYDSLSGWAQVLRACARVSRA